MTQYEITLALNRIIMEHSEFTTWTVSTPHLMMLINEAIAAEREECAKVCETNHGTIRRNLDSYQCAAAIRARGQE